MGVAAPMLVPLPYKVRVPEDIMAPALRHLPSWSNPYYKDLITSNQLGFAGLSKQVPQEYSFLLRGGCIFPS